MRFPFSHPSKYRISPSIPESTAKAFRVALSESVLAKTAQTQQSKPCLLAMSNSGNLFVASFASWPDRLVQLAESKKDLAQLLALFLEFYFTSSPFVYLFNLSFICCYSYVITDISYRLMHSLPINNTTRSQQLTEQVVRLVPPLVKNIISESNTHLKTSNGAELIAAVEKSELNRRKGISAGDANAGNNTEKNSSDASQGKQEDATAATSKLSTSLAAEDDDEDDDDDMLNDDEEEEDDSPLSSALKPRPKQMLFGQPKPKATMLFSLPQTSLLKPKSAFVTRFLEQHPETTETHQTTPSLDSSSTRPHLTLATTGRSLFDLLTELSDILLVFFMRIGQTHLFFSHIGPLFTTKTPLMKEDVYFDSLHAFVSSVSRMAQSSADKLVVPVATLKLVLNHLLRCGYTCSLRQVISSLLPFSQDDVKEFLKSFVLTHHLYTVVVEYPLHFLTGEEAQKDVNSLNSNSEQNIEKQLNSTCAILKIIWNKTLAEAKGSSTASQDASSLSSLIDKTGEIVPERFTQNDACAFIFACFTLLFKQELLLPFRFRLTSTSLKAFVASFYASWLLNFTTSEPVRANTDEPLPTTLFSLNPSLIPSESPLPVLMKIDYPLTSTLIIRPLLLLALTQSVEMGTSQIPLINIPRIIDTTSIANTLDNTILSSFISYPVKDSPAYTPQQPEHSRSQTTISTVSMFHSAHSHTPSSLPPPGTSTLPQKADTAAVLNVLEQASMDLSNSSMLEFSLLSVINSIVSLSGLEKD